MGFDNLSNSFGTGMQAGTMAAGQGRFGSVNEGLQNLLQLMLAKKQRDDYFAQQQQLQQQKFRQDTALQQMSGQQAQQLQAKAAQQRAWQDRINAHQQQMQLQQRLAGAKNIANIRAGASLQNTQARADQQRRQNTIKMMTAGTPTPYQLAEMQSKVPWWDMLHMTPQSQAYQSLQATAQNRNNLNQKLLNSAGEGTTQEPNADELYNRYMQEVSDNQLVQE